MKEETRKFKIRLIEPLLGGVPKDKEIYKTFVKSKAPSEADTHDELETHKEVEEKGWTGFHSDENGLILYNYVTKGYLKSACETLIGMGTIKKIPAYKKWFDKLVHITPRRIPLGVSEPDGTMERPLRAMTQQGPRITLSRSDYINAGRELEFEVTLLTNNKGITWEIIDACLELAKWGALGPWRGSGGYGAFEVIENSQ